MGFFSQLFASAIGGAIAGFFVVVGVWLQFRRQSEAALRALSVEVDSNAKIALEMLKGTSQRNQAGAFPQLGPDPGWLRRSVWDSQLPYVVQVLAPDTMALVSDAYGSLDAVPRMFYRYPDQPQGTWSVGGSVDNSIRQIESTFRQTAEALRVLGETIESRRWSTRANVIFEAAKAKFLPK
jgi:hypothetical protein